MIKKPNTNNQLISSLGIGMIFLSGVGSLSEAMEIVSTQAEENNQSNYMAELALTIIDYDHYTHIATNLDLSLLNFSEQERKQLALDLNPSSNSSQSIAKIPVPSVDGARILLSDSNENGQSNTLYTSYMASNLEVVTPEVTNEKEHKIAVLPKTDINNVYDSVYEFDIAIKKEEYTLSSGIGKMLSDDDNSGKSAQDVQTTYNGLQTQMVDYLNDYSRTRRAQAVAQATNGNTLAQVAGGPGSVAPPPVSRGNSWFVFFSIGQQVANPSGLIATGVVDPVQQQLALQQASRARIQQRTQSFYRPPTSPNVRY